MSNINCFEEIKAWQKARELVKLVYKKSITSGFSKDFGLKDQTQKAAVSIMANIAEGFGRRSNLEFANFLNYAHGSVAEVQSHLFVAVDQSYINDEDFKLLYNQCDEVSRMILSLENYLRKFKSSRS